MAVANGACHLAYGKRVEIVVNENRGTECGGENVGTSPTFDLRHRPFGKRCGATSHQDKRGDDAQRDKEQENQNVIGVECAFTPENLRESTPDFDDCCDDPAVFDKECSGDNAGCERHDDLLGRDDKSNRKNRWDECENGVCLGHGGLLNTVGMNSG